MVFTILPVIADLRLELSLSFQGFLHLLRDSLARFLSVQELTCACLLHYLCTCKPGELAEPIRTVHDGVPTTPLSISQQEVTVCTHRIQTHKGKKWKSVRCKKSPTLHIIIINVQNKFRMFIIQNAVCHILHQATLSFSPSHQKANYRFPVLFRILQKTKRCVYCFHGNFAILLQGWRRLYKKQLTVNAYECICRKKYYGGLWFWINQSQLNICLFP